MLQCCSNVAAKVASVPSPFQVISDTTNRPLSTLQPRASPDTSSPATPGVREFTATTPSYVPTTNVPDGDAANVAVHECPGDEAATVTRFVPRLPAPMVELELVNASCWPAPT